ncbi:MAG: bifunctional methionine sulfoxide reductase B/A protein [Acidobacteria bacterium]|nr:bifunctional methionine sulfoxide reductase B/A protein [Acidobacteriota bacterium]
MKRLLLPVLILLAGLSIRGEEAVNYRKLTPEEARVILRKGTERPFSGKYETFNERGTYVCKRCGAPLYQSHDKFDGHCGWPSFDDEIKGAVKRIPDPDGKRIEILCANCDAHLGHVFIGEHFTRKNTRHCVNSVSLLFVPKGEPLPPVVRETKPRREVAIFAGGCFWGVESLLKEKKGVLDTTVGYTGGHKPHPSYKDVSYTNSGHAEAVEVVFDPDVISYRELCRYFFEIHDPTQWNRQGPDVGSQYRSEIFYTSDEQKKTADETIEELKKKGYDVATKVHKAGHFWKAEEYHQDYYTKTGKTPYCHFFTKRF